VSEVNELGYGTWAVWGGEEQPAWRKATQLPVIRRVGYGYDPLREWRDVATGRRRGYIYSRNANPTVAVFEEKLRILEGAEAATSFATGMAAISGTLFTLLPPGSRVVSIKDSYGGTSRLFLEHLPGIDVEVMLCETTDLRQIEREVAGGCNVLYLETPTNPLLKVLDLKRLAQAGRNADAVVVVDNTFALPINQNPLTLGADLVIHSATKYLGGHADALGGVVCGSAALVRRICQHREITGGSLEADSAYLLVRRMKTLQLRIRQQNASGLEIARFPERHPAVGRVFYPGLESHPQHDIARRQMRGFGGMLSFQVAGDVDAVPRVLESLKLAHRSASLGHVETFAGTPDTTSHVECTAEQRAALGIPDTLIRYSVGIEVTRDLVADLDQALETVRPTASHRPKPIQAESAR